MTPEFSALRCQLKLVDIVDLVSKHRAQALSLDEVCNRFLYVRSCDKRNPEVVSARLIVVVACSVDGTLYNFAARTGFVEGITAPWEADIDGALRNNDHCLFRALIKSGKLDALADRRSFQQKR